MPIEYFDTGISWQLSWRDIRKKEIHMNISNMPVKYFETVGISYPAIEFFSTRSDYF